MSRAETPSDNLESLGWDELIAFKRRLSGELKVLTDKLIDIDRNKFHSINNSIRDHKTNLDPVTNDLRQVKSEIDRNNSNLLLTSEKISQSKNFLSMMESRLPSESEEELTSTIQHNEKLIDNKEYKSERQKNEILSRIKDASMKLEAIKAVRTIKEQFNMLNAESISINGSTQLLLEKKERLQQKISQINNSIDKLYDTKRALAMERDTLLKQYDKTVMQFDAVNARLDQMSEMRKKQRQEYGYNLPSDALFKVREAAKKKLASGSKLSLEELKLLFNDKE